MRIGIDLRGVIYDSAKRGIGVYATNLVRGLMHHAPKDWEFCLFHREGFPLPQGLEPLPPGWSAIPVQGWSWQDPTPHWAVMRLPKVRGLPFLRKAYSRALEEWNRTAFEKAVSSSGVDLLHLASAVDLGSYPLVRAKVPVVASFLDAIPLREADRYFNRWTADVQMRYRAQIEQLSRVAKVVAISEFSRLDAIRLANVAQERTATVYPVVDERWYQEPNPVWATDIRAKLGLVDPHFVFCSALDGHKNWERMLQAFAPLEERAHLVVVAKDTGPAADAFLALRQRLAIPADRCILTGWVEDHELIGLVAGATALVSPSLQEGFGLPAAQAQALGTPVLASTGGSLPEVVAEAGLRFDPLDVEAQSAAMTQALGQDLRAEFADRSKALRERFREEVVSGELVRIYRDVLAEPEGGSVS